MVAIISSITIAPCSRLVQRDDYQKEKELQGHQLWWITAIVKWKHPTFIIS